MPPRRGFSRVVPARSKRATAWGIGPGSSVATAFSIDTSTILGSGVALVTEDRVTIVRIRGALQAFLTAATAAADGFHCALGIGIVSADAFAVGVTAVPNPLDDMAWPGWMYHRFFDVHSGGTFNAADGGVQVRFEVDSKAMRKFGINETLFGVLQVVEDTTAVMQVYFDSRILVKLS